MNKKVNGVDYLTYYVNDFLSSKQGQSLMKEIFTDTNSDIVKNIQKRVDAHNAALEQLKNPPKQEQALNNEEGVIPGYMSIPQNINPKKPTQDPQLPSGPQLGMM